MTSHEARYLMRKLSPVQLEKLRDEVKQGASLAQFLDRGYKASLAGFVVDFIDGKNPKEVEKRYPRRERMYS